MILAGDFDREGMLPKGACFRCKQIRIVLDIMMEVDLFFFFKLQS